MPDTQSVASGPLTQRICLLLAWGIGPSGLVSFLQERPMHVAFAVSRTVQCQVGGNSFLFTAAGRCLPEAWHCLPVSESITTRPSPARLFDSLSRYGLELLCVCSSLSRAAPGWGTACWPGTCGSTDVDGGLCLPPQMYHGQTPGMWGNPSDGGWLALAIGIKKAAAELGVREPGGGCVSITGECRIAQLGSLV